MTDEMYKAIAAECMKIKDCRVYRDNHPQNFREAAYLVVTVDTECVRQLHGMQKVTHSMDVQYFPESPIQGRYRECEDMKEEMLRRFDVIEADGVSFYVRGKTANITDDVLHFLFDVTYTEYPEKDVPKVEDMSLNTKTEE